MSYLADTNTLLRLTDQNSSLQTVVQNALIVLRKQGEELVIVPQNLIEFWAVATRPVADNGLGLSVVETAQELNRLKVVFRLLPDTPGIFTEWEQLVIRYQVMGKQAHDARLVAAMKAHGLTHLLTFNTADFKRFTEITAVNPRNV